MLVWARRRWVGSGTSAIAEVWRIDARAAGPVRFSHVDVLTELGIGIAIGMLAGTTGTHGSARGRMTLLAAVIGLVAGFLLRTATSARRRVLGLRRRRRSPAS